MNSKSTSSQSDVLRSERNRNERDSEAQYLEMSFAERFDTREEPLMLARFQVDLADRGVVCALARVTDRLSPFEAMELALHALENATHGARLGVHVINSKNVAHLTEMIATIVERRGTSKRRDAPE